MRELQELLKTRQVESVSEIRETSANVQSLVKEPFFFSLFFTYKEGAENEQFIFSFKTKLEALLSRQEAVCHAG